MDCFVPRNDGLYLMNYLELLAKSYKHFLKKNLITNLNDLNTANFVCASHYYYEDEPKFIYGNQAALKLWELDQESFIGMPSKFTAEAVEREDRQKLLDEVNKNGYIKNYSGIRISSTGKRFMIKDAVVWNVLNEQEQTIGQAVKFEDYEYITAEELQHT